MANILLITARRERIQSFIAGLSGERQARLDVATTGAEALEVVRKGCPDLVIVDSTSDGVDSLEMVRRIIGVNAMANTAVVSALSDEDFHDEAEGLGILCRLPEAPGSEDSKALLQRLRDVTGIS